MQHASQSHEFSIGGEIIEACLLATPQLMRSSSRAKWMQKVHFVKSVILVLSTNGLALPSRESSDLTV